MHNDFSQIGPFLLAALLVFAIYRRLRRSFGRQVLSPPRMILRMVLLAAITVLLLPLALRSTPFLSAELAGAALGIAMGVWGAERTRFQMYGERLHYVPHTYTGIAVSLLFLGRLAFRIAQVYWNPQPLPAAHAAAAPAFAPASMLQSPLTVGIFFVLAGYYVVFYSMVLWKSKHLKPQDIEVAPAAAAR